MEGTTLFSLHFYRDEDAMIKREEGFTLVELMVTVVVFVLVIAAASRIFTGLLTQFKQQSKIAETNIERIVGLDILRRDISNAGYGLPWSYPAGWVCAVGCGEASSSPANTYNDFPVNVPRAVVTGNDVAGGTSLNILNGTDYIVVKAVNVATNAACQKSTNLREAPFSAAPPGNPRIWDAFSDRLGVDEKGNATNEYVTVLSLGTTTDHRLITNGSNFSTRYNNVTSAPWPPTDRIETRVIYAVDPSTALRMPFNRADFFVSTANVPTRCAPNTGVLEKVVVNQSDGGLTAFMPLLDCVADMQVGFGLDMNGDGELSINSGTYSNADGTSVASFNEGAVDVPATLNDPGLLRRRLKEMRVYVLAHEGQADPSYTYATNPVTVGEKFGGVNIGRDYNLSADMLRYRWKVYTLVIKSDNL